MKNRKAKQENRENMQKSRSQKEFREKELKRKREKYAKNPKPKRKQARQHYQNNKVKMREMARDKARALKYDSETYMAKYVKSIEFGPEFVCICCHGGFFEDQVLAFNEKRKNKIGSELNKRSCEINDIKKKLV